MQYEEDINRPRPRPPITTPPIPSPDPPEEPEPPKEGYKECKISYTSPL